MVLDHLNPALKKLGLWYPVDVSTSAQATLGGMAGNNSCGSRSIAYGNMVHNVLGAQAWTADGELHRFGRFEDCVGRAREIGDCGCRTWPPTLAPEIERRWPKVLRRVGGYNLDIFHNQNERPYTGDGSVNLAHLLVGSEGTLALTRSLTLQLAELPQRQGAGRGELPDLLQGDGLGPAHRQAGHGDGATLTAVELVDRTMIELSLQNPAFAPGHPHRRDRPARRRAAGGVFRRRQGGAGAQARPAGRADGRPGPARLGGAHDRRRAAEEPVGSAQGRPEHHDEPQGRRQAGELHRGLRRAAGAPGRIHRRADPGVPQARQPRHLVRPRLGRHAARAADPGHAHATARPRCAPSPRRPRRWCASTRAPTAASTATACAAASGSAGSSARRSTRPSPQIKDTVRPAATCCARSASSIRRAWTTPRLMRYSPGYKVIPLQTALDWSALGRAERPGHRAHHARPAPAATRPHGFAKAVEMCNNNGHCRKFDAGTMCPSYRVTRDEKHSTRGRANTLRLALSGSRGSAPDGAGRSEAVKDAMDLCVSCKGCKRDCPTGVDMAKMKVEFLHHYKAAPRLHAEGQAGRPPARLRAHGQPLRGPAEPAQQQPLAGAARREGAGLLGAAQPAGVAGPPFLQHAPVDCHARARCWRRRGRWCCSSTPSTAIFESSNARAALKVLQAAGYTVHVATKLAAGRQAPVLRPHLPVQRHGGRSQGQGARSGGRRCCRSPRRASPSSAWSRRAC